jgi:hypothetical protein
MEGQVWGEPPIYTSTSNLKPKLFIVLLCQYNLCLCTKLYCVNPSMHNTIRSAYFSMVNLGLIQYGDNIIILCHNAHATIQLKNEVAV